MQEIELKFQVPAAQRSAVAKAVAGRSGTSTRLQAIYFDTPERHLAKAGIALRLRKEGRRWVQTFKASGDDAMRRIEVNTVLAQGAAPALDLRHLADTPAATRLDEALRGPQAADALAEHFRTDVRRVHRQVRIKGGLLELAFDSGRITTGPRAIPVCELEIELLRGEPLALIDAARRWIQRHALWLDVRSKAERGDRLARGVDVPSARKGGRSPLLPEAGFEAAWRLAVRHGLAQILPNASDIAGGSFGDEQVHQLRVGLRRVRSLLRFFGVEAQVLDAAAEAAMSELFEVLGGARDRDVLAATLMPALQAAGAPLVELPAATTHQAAGERLRAPPATLLWLTLLAAASEPAPAAADRTLQVEPEAPPAQAPASLERFASDRLRRWHRRIVRQATEFLALSDEERHRLRKRAKRLRYAVEFAAPLYGRKRVERYLARMRPLQDALGELNDLAVAQRAYAELVGDDGRAWFAVGWLAAQREAVLARCARTLKDFAEAPRFWKR